VRYARALPYILHASAHVDASKGDSDSAFQRRIAGHVETGRHSVSDPGLGLADQF
jgi:hypothetical protein